MRYIDTGSRDPKHALGSWLGDVLLASEPITSLRLQTGFFGVEALGYFEGTLKALANSDGHTRILVGSNDGLTPRAAAADLLKITGQPRNGLRVGVVSFQTGFFHPKVYHLQRADGSSAAYVGSANLTGSGTTSLHVEAGIIVDTNDGDSQSVLTSIADAIDAWFSGSGLGLYEISSDADLDPLVAAEVLGVTAPPRPKRAKTMAKESGKKAQTGHSLKPLVAMPAIQTPLTPKLPSRHTPSTAAQLSATPQPEPTATPSTSPIAPQPPTAATAVKHWGKVLSNSDAQRKKMGNQRGAITLVQGDYRGQIDQTVYFRHDLFGQQAWSLGSANTGQPVETALVPMHVTINGIYHGVMDFKITSAPNRESSQNNYTAELHVEPVTPLFSQTNMSGRHLDIAIDAGGDYWLTIA